MRLSSPHRSATWHFDGDAPLVAAACAAAVAACLLLVGMGSSAYRTVLGISHPIGPTLAVVVFGFAGWLLLVRQSWIPAQAPDSRGIRLAGLLGLALPAPVIVVDLLGGFGPDINAAAPDSFLFYPSIAVVAELALHIAPMSAAALIAAAVRPATRALEVIGLASAAAIEPVVQVLWSAQDTPDWATAYVGLHLLLFNVLGLFLLRRFGFIRVLVYRISYYLVWHVAWGHVRLDLLFSS